MKLFSLVWTSYENSAKLLPNDDPGGPKSPVRMWQNYEEHFTRIHKSHCKIRLNIGQIMNGAYDSETEILYRAYNIKNFKCYRDQLSKQ
jgi:hypothetical protein